MYFVNDFIGHIESIENHHNVTSFRNNYTMLETSHFNNNILSTLAEREDNLSKRVTERLAEKNQSRMKAETTARNPTKPMKSSISPPPNGNISLERDLYNQKSITKGKSEQNTKRGYHPSSNTPNKGGLINKSYQANPGKSNTKAQEQLQSL